jgi:hypothetical protein
VSIKHGSYGGEGLKNLNLSKKKKKVRHEVCRLRTELTTQISVFDIELPGVASVWDLMLML